MKKRQRAQVLMRDGLHYRKQAFENGIQQAGYEPTNCITNPTRDDVLVIWNRSFRGAEDAERFERVGARVLVTENGYLGKGWRGGNWYCLALGHHAGAGSWPVGGAERWDGWGVSLAPWKEGGTETILLGQRGIGERGIKSPIDWAEHRQKEIGGRIRPHPGKRDPTVPLAEDLANAKEVVTWASSAALQALMLGVPVWYEMPRWIGAMAARPLHELLEGQPPKRDDAARLEMFRRLAWSLWQLSEIQSGAAFKHLLDYKEE